MEEVLHVLPRLHLSVNGELSEPIPLRLLPELTPLDPLILLLLFQALEERCHVLGIRDSDTVRPHETLEADHDPAWCIGPRDTDCICNLTP